MSSRRKAYVLFIVLSVLLCVAVLVYEHAILSKDDLSRLNVAFFNLNGVISIALCLFTYLDLAL